jgi:hypothetical protein
MLADNQFDAIPDFYSSRKLIKQKFIESKLTAKGLPEIQDKEAFEIPKDGRHPIPADMYKFKLPLRTFLPSEDYNNYLYYLE